MIPTNKAPRQKRNTGSRREDVSASQHSGSDSGRASAAQPAGQQSSVGRGQSSPRAGESRREQQGRRRDEDSGER